MYIGKFGTLYIAIPKYDNLKHLPPKNGKRFDSDYIYIALGGNKKGV